MSDREQREFELILGNKQLFSVLLLVVILLGVFFAMGYLAGRSGTTVTAANPPAPKAYSQPPAQPTDPPPGEEPKRAPTEPATEPPTSATKAQLKRESPKPSPIAAAQEEPAGPPDGRYLQASALPKAQAEAMVKLLTKDGQRAYLALSPRRSTEAPELYRVLLGPLANNDELAAGRAYLKEKGIDKPIPRTYPDAHSN